MVKRVGIICYKGFGTDGISSFIYNNYKHFSNHSEIKYYLIYPMLIGEPQMVNVHLEEFKKNGDQTICIPKSNGLWQYIKSCMHFIRSEKIDIIHVHGSSASISLELLLCQLIGVKKTIAHSHNTQGNHKFIHRLLVPLVNLLANKKVACGVLAGKWMYGVKEEYAIIPNGVDTRRFIYNDEIRNEIRRELSIEKDEIVIGHIGGFNEVKNQKFIIHILEELNRKSKKTYKIILAGRGSLVENTKKKIALLGLDKQVIFLGQRNDIYKVINTFDVFVLPSLYEGFPIVAVEAQASGLPVLLSDTIANEVHITDKVQFLPINQGAKVWAEAIDKVLIDNDSRFKYADTIEKSGFDIRKSAKLLEELYLE